MKQFTIDEIRVLLAGISSPPYDVVAGDNCGDYGSGPDAHSGFTSYAVVDSEGRTIVDSFNSTAAEIHEEVDEDNGMMAWDEVGRCNVAFFAAAPSIITQLLERERSVFCVHCGESIYRYKTPSDEEAAKCLEIARKHDEECSKNPLVRRIQELEARVRFLQCGRVEVEVDYGK